MSQVITKQGVLENDRIVNYEQQGAGAPVILTHGLAASLHDWDELLPLLAEKGRAVETADAKYISANPLAGVK